MLSLLAVLLAVAGVHCWLWFYRPPVPWHSFSILQGATLVDSSSGSRGGVKFFRHQGAIEVVYLRSLKDMKEEFGTVRERSTPFGGRRITSSRGPLDVTFNFFERVPSGTDLSVVWKYAEVQRIPFGASYKH